MSEIGAMIPDMSKNRWPLCKCDLCSCSFEGIRALKMHQAFLHPKTKRAPYKPKIEVIKEDRLLKRTNITISTKLLKQFKKLEEKVLESKVENKEINNVRSNGFECTVCSKLFTAYLSAYKHIQDNHCGNKGETVAPNSSNLIQPLYVEHCITCNVKVNIEHHTCNEIYKNNDDNFTLYHTCFGCLHDFKSVHTFETHIEKKHSKYAEFYFFPTIDEFIAWKKNVETQMKVDYLLMKDRENSQVFHCNNFVRNINISGSCPSSISTQVFNEGIQVTFYRKHYVHTSKDYILPKTYKKYNITSLMKSVNSQNVSLSNNSIKDMHLGFECLMGNIVKEAEKVNLNDLRLLLGKALEMAFDLNSLKNKKKILNNHTGKKLTDVEIRRLPDEPEQNKRKLESNDNVAKRMKTEYVAKMVPIVILNRIDNKKYLVSTEEAGFYTRIIKDGESLAEPKKLKRSLKSWGGNAKIPKICNAKNL